MLKTNYDGGGGECDDDDDGGDDWKYDDNDWKYDDEDLKYDDEWRQTRRAVAFFWGVHHTLRWFKLYHIWDYLHHTLKDKLWL